MSFSIILSYKSDGSIRDRHVAYTVARYARLFPTAEIIVSKQDGTDGWNGFNKSRTINDGVRNSSFSTLLITDIDMIFSREGVVEGLDLIASSCYIVPYSRRIELEKDITFSVLDSYSDPFEMNLDIANPKIDSDIVQIGGCHIVKKADVLRVKGYDEKFVGWGREDTSFGYAIATICDGYPRVVDRIGYHLWHETSFRNNSNNEVTASPYINANYNKQKMLKVIEEKLDPFT